MIIRRFKHMKTGGVYRVVAFAFRESDKARMVVYQSESDSSLWIREEGEFNDGRFQRVEDVQKIDHGKSYMPLMGTPFGLDFVALNEIRARENHDQTLTQLANRGGMHPVEALANVSNQPWPYATATSIEDALTLIQRIAKRA